MDRSYEKGETIGWHLVRLKDGQIFFLGMSMTDETEVQRRANVMNEGSTSSFYFPVEVRAGVDVAL